MGSVSLRGVRKLYGPIEVIKGIDLDVADGELAVFVGPSGCGKSTLLRMVAGLEDVDYGAVLIDGHDVTETAPARRGVAMVFQNYALYPHMTAFDNIAYGLRRAGLPSAEVEKRVRDAAAMLRIEPLLGRKPRAMSGGQRQRVAIGRAIVRNPKVFLFDEPLSNLDAALRIETRAQIARLHRDLGATMIFVTHDQVEAMTLADRIIVLNGGQVEQIGKPLDLYNDPVNLFVAGFIGSPKINLIPGRIDGNSGSAVDLRLSSNGCDLAIEGRFDGAVGDPVTMGVRPEQLRLEGGQRVADVVLAEHLGGETVLHIEDGGLPLILKSPGERNVHAGDRISYGIDCSGACLFDADGRSLRRG